MDVFLTPILLLIYNRPDSTKRVFEEIRKQKPKYLYIAADGPKDGHWGKKLCTDARKIAEQIDWDCELKTLFRDKNMGCKYAVSSAISWFFDHVEEGIILEDDCLPNSSFFIYCEELLKKYKNNDKIKMICGTSYQPKPLNSETYYFSKYVHVWGWATWKRAWHLYNHSLDEEVETDRKNIITQTFKDKREQKLWENNLNLINNGFDTWDYQWMYWIWKDDGICIIPWKNLVSNIGFGDNATHTYGEQSPQSKMQQFELETIVHPVDITPNKDADTVERYSILIDPYHKFIIAKIIFEIKKSIKQLLFFKKI